MATGPVTVTLRRGLTWTRDDLDAPEEAVLAVASLPPGVNEIGDVMLVPLPIVASGQLTGVVPEFSRIGIELAKKDGDRWQRESGFELDWDGEGGFELRAAIAPGTPIRLSPKPMHSLPVEPIEVPAGTTGIEIDLVAGGEATAWFLADETTPVDLLRIAIAPQDQPASADREWRADGLLIHSEHGFGIPWRGLTPGRYRLTVRSPVSARPLLEITDLEAPSGGACEDPRLKNIDLRPLLALAEVRVQGADGAPMVASDAFVVVTHDQRDWPAIPIVDGIAHVPIADAAVPILAIVPGYLAVETTVGPSGATVRLDRSPAIAVRAILSAPIPDDVDFELRLVPTDERLRSARITIPRGLDIPAGSGPAVHRFAVSVEPGADGVAMLRPLLDAAHTFVARVGRTTVRDASGSCDVPPGAREVTFRPHPERLAEAIADR